GRPHRYPPEYRLYPLVQPPVWVGDIDCCLLPTTDPFHPSSSEWVLRPWVRKQKDSLQTLLQDTKYSIGTMDQHPECCVTGPAPEDELPETTPSNPDQADDKLSGYLTGEPQRLYFEICVNFS